MSTPNTDAIARKANETERARTDAVTALLGAVTEAGRMREEADDVERAAWDTATKAGWSDAQLKAIGLTKPPAAKKTARRRTTGSSSTSSSGSSSAIEQPAEPVAVAS